MLVQSIRVHVGLYCEKMPPRTRVDVVPGERVYLTPHVYMQPPLLPVRPVMYQGP